MKTPVDRAQLNALYKPSSDHFSEIDVPEMPFLAVEMEGAPTQEIAQAITKWLYTAVHPIRQRAKKEFGAQFLEPPIEALFAIEGDIITKWRMMIVLPYELEQDFLDECLSKVTNALGQAPGTVIMERFAEGACIQIMHIGDLDSQKETLNSLYHSYLPDHNLKAQGWYHEIYLNDHQRVAPEKRKTILRQAIRT